MKKLFKNLPMVLMVMALSVACGKENSSGDTSDSKITGDIDSITGTSSVNEVRKVFENKSMADHLTAGENGTQIVRLGSSTGGQQGDNMDCDDILWGFAQFCTSSSSSTSSGLKAIKVAEASSSAIKYREATESNNSGFIFGDILSAPYDRGNSSYVEMLSIDREPIAIRTSLATITFVNNYGQNVGTKSGTLVEYFYGTNDPMFNHTNITEVKRYVLSTQLPVISNPIVSLNQYGFASERLISVNGNYVKSVKAPRYHKVVYDQNGKQTIQAQNQEINL